MPFARVTCALWLSWSYHIAIMFSRNEYREFRCKFCTVVRRLPASILEQKSPHQARLSTGEMCTGIVCPECRRAFGYKAEEMLPVLSDNPNPYRDPTGTSWISVDVLCV